MQSFIRLVARGALLLATAAALQAASSWSVRVRATYMMFADRSDAIGAIPADTLKVNDLLIPEFDVDYSFTDNLSAELVLTIPQTQDVSLVGTKLGTFKHLPPTLLLQYKFNPHGKIQPYVGAGANYTLIWGDDLAVGNLALRLDNHSTGAAAQAGVDVKIDGHWSINLDAKWVQIRSDVTAAGVKITQARLDPMLYAAGVRYAF